MSQLGRRTLSTIAVAVAVCALLAQPVQRAAAATSPFTDIAGSPFEADIDWLFAEGLTVGCEATLYCPTKSTTRAQMASFLVRMLGLTAGADVDAFSDDDGTSHEADINRLAFAGITSGCSATAFCPADPVLRDQLASLLTRAVPLTNGAGNNYFRDDNTNAHEADIDRLAAAGIATGCGQWRFCPSAIVSRGQMAAFLHRVQNPVAELPHPAPNLTTLYVTTTGADAANACLSVASPCRTIRRALSQAVEGDSLVIGAGTFFEENLVVTVDLTITGNASGTTIDATGGARARVLSVPAGRTVSITDLTIRGGRADLGGGIDNLGSLSLDHVTIIDNRAAYFGGGIYSHDGALSIVDSVITGNQALGRPGQGLGGGIYTEDTRYEIGGHARPLLIQGTTISGNLAMSGGGVIASHAAAVITDSVIDGNEAGVNGDGFGGGLYNWGGMTVIRTRVTGNSTSAYGGGIVSSSAERLVIDQSTIDGNMAGRGGGIYSHNPIYTLTNSTVAGNTAVDTGGGIHFAGGIATGDTGVRTVTNSTITGNQAPEGAGIFRDVFYPNIQVGFRNSLLLGNVGPEATGVTFGPIASLIGIPAGLTLGDILVPAGLADNGGPTRTIALVDSPGNPAVDAGNDAICAAAPVNGLDQRGLPRSSPCDIGAFEIQP
jgi:predicted outer membrane repeat protein